MVLKECYMCGEMSSEPRPTSYATAAFPSVRARRYAASKVMVDQVQHEVKTAEAARTSTIQSPHPAPTPPAATQQPATKRPKSKGGLQGMLQRNREREMRESQKESTNVGLVSFLQGL
ncbi:hypothetical protein FRC08_015288 [Ceratobasidium sp. 394]|nr:hypothetical protein FRC08_015288 [Ceratobasidium sp. 394]